MKTFFKWIWYTKVGKLLVMLPTAIAFLVLAEYHGYVWMYIAAAAFGIFPIGIILAGFGYIYIVRPYIKIRDWFKNRKNK